MTIASYIDHTILKPEATVDDIRKLCEEAKKYKFIAVCINPVFVPIAREVLLKSGVQIATVVGFPLGANTSYIKAKETEKAISDGATEIDMVMTVGLFKSRYYDEVESDMKAVINIASGLPVKVIIETSLLSSDEITVASRLAVGCGAKYIKTSTGFGSRGVSFEDIKIIKEAIGDNGKIKASGGIRDYKFAKELIDLGVNRIGTSSGVRIMKDESDFIKHH